MTCDSNVMAMRTLLENKFQGNQVLRKRGDKMKSEDLGL